MDGTFVAKLGEISISIKNLIRNYPNLANEGNNRALPSTVGCKLKLQYF